MKKQIILLLSLLATFVTLSAQDVENPVPEGELAAQKHLYWTIGVSGGFDQNYHIVDMSYMIDYHYAKYAKGSSFGVQLGFSPWDWLTLRVDGVMLQKNYTRSHVVGGTTTSLPDTAYNRYLNVPVMLMLNVGKTVRLHAYGGGYWGRWLECKRVGVTNGMNGLVSYSETVDFDSPESQVRDNRNDVGLVWGGGLSTVIKRRIELGVEARWYYGLQDIQKDYMAHLNPRYNTTFVVQGSVGFLF